MEKAALNKGQILILFVMVLFTLGMGKPQIWNDTQEYLTFSSFRPPLYPIFLWLCRVMGSYQLTAAMWVQTLIGFTCLIYTGNWLIKYYYFSKWMVCTILSITLYLFFYYFEFSKNILSEGLAFPLFLLTFTRYIECMVKCSIKNIVALSIYTNLLILTREQFYYFYLLLFFLILFYMVRSINIKNIFLIVTIMIVSCSSTNLINRVYHYNINHHFRDASVMGEMMYYKALYFSNKNDEKYFHNKSDKYFFANVIKQYELNHITYDSASSLSHLYIGATYLDDAYYNMLYNQITAKKIMQDSLHSITQDTKDYVSNDLLWNMSKLLLLHHIGINVKFVVWKTGIYSGNIYILISFLIVLAAFTLRLLVDKAWQPTPIACFISGSILIVTANAGFVSLVGHYETRFFIYSYFIYLCLAGLIAEKLVLK